jgi:hypothetical protein
MWYNETVVAIAPWRVGRLPKVPCVAGPSSSDVDAVTPGQARNSATRSLKSMQAVEKHSCFGYPKKTVRRGGQVDFAMPVSHGIE